MTHKDQGNQTPYALAEDHLWRDVIHASEVGSFVAGMTAYAAIYGKEPVGKNPLDYSLQEFFPTAGFLSPAGAQVIERIAWNAYLYALRSTS